MIATSRSLFTALSHNPVIREKAESGAISKSVVRRFVAGNTRESALTVAQSLQLQGMDAALDYLGEDVALEADANDALCGYIALLEQMKHAGLDSPYISVKLTALGLILSEERAEQRLIEILQIARVHNTFVCVDMEDSAYTERTIAMVRRAHRNFENVGTVLQSYLYRTPEDLAAMAHDGICIRLVKGAYNEPASVAYTHKHDVDAAYLRLAKDLLKSGTQPAIATHDESILHEIKRFMRLERIDNDDVEFQMLLGVRRDLQKSLQAEGYYVRIYVPFGDAWYPYLMRRLAERPANVGFVLKQLIQR